MPACKKGYGCKFLPSAKGNVKIKFFVNLYLYLWLNSELSSPKIINTLLSNKD